MKYIPEETLSSLCRGFAGECSLYVSLPFLGESFTYKAHQSINAASTIKIPLLAKLFQDAEDGKLDLDRPLVMDPVNRVRGSGILKFLSTEVPLSLYDLAVLMMIVSDNSATNQVIDAVGIAEANAYFRENGWEQTVLNKKLFIPNPDCPEGTALGNFTSAADLGALLEKMLAGTLVSKKASEQMMSIMACQQLGKFSQSLPGVLRPQNSRDMLGDVPEGKVMLVEKGGTLKGRVSHDAAIMLLPNGRHAVLVMMTQCENPDASLEVIKNVSRALYDRLIAD